MSEKPVVRPPRLQAIVEDFALCEGREKLELLLQFAGQLPPLPEWLKAHKERLEPVPECMTPVFAHAEVAEGRMRYYLDVPDEAPRRQTCWRCRRRCTTRWACRPC
jgi:cysteine desulfuration protein SufE